MMTERERTNFFLPRYSLVPHFFLLKALNKNKKNELIKTRKDGVVQMKKKIILFFQLVKSFEV